MIADRIQRIGFSSTFRINAAAKKMRAEGIDVIDFSVGEPDFPTPENIKGAAKAALDKDFTKYTVSSGIPELRKAVCKKFREEYGADKYTPEQVIISTGGKQSLYNACVALLNKGDEVICPIPYWVSYPQMINLAKGEPVYVRTREENGFRLTTEDLSRAVTARTKAIILNNPSNPTGAAYNPDDLLKIIDVCMNENIFIISDEIYEKLIYDGFRMKSVAAFGEEVQKKSLIVNGFSKAYAMTGWRLGYAVGPLDIIQAMGKIQSHSTSNANTMTQWAGVEALLGPQHEISRMRTEFERRRNFLLYRTENIPHVSCNKPEGAFYTFVNTSWYYDKQFEGAQIRNSAGLAYYLLKKAHVAVVPGDAFGADDFIRLSYATSMENLEKAMDRITDALAKLQPTSRSKRISLRNTDTRIKKSVYLDSTIDMESRDALQAEAEANMTYDTYQEWNISVGGVVLKLATNSPHLIDFWIDNWYPAPLESDIEPHGVLYGVKSEKGREPGAYYNGTTRTAFLVNSAYYPQLRAIAMGMVDDIASRMFDTFLIRGNCVDFGGRGVVLMGPSGTGLTTNFAGLLRHPEARLHSMNGFFVRWAGSEPIADSVERKFLIGTDIVSHLPEFTGLFDRCKLENVAAGDSEGSACPLGDNCPLKRGEPRCYVHNKGSRALLDPYWVGGTARHVKRTQIEKIILMQRDNLAPSTQVLKPQEALHRLAEGAYSSGRGAWKNLPFYNKYLLGRYDDRKEHLLRQWKRLLDRVELHVVNIEHMSPQETQKTIRGIVGV